MRPPLTSIEPLLEGRGTDAAIGVEEPLAVLAHVRIGSDHGLDRIHDAFGIEAGTHDFGQTRIFRARAAEQDLVILDAFAVDAQNADMPDMVMAAGIDAAGNLDLQLAEIVLAFQIGKAFGDRLSRWGWSAHWPDRNNPGPGRR